MPISPQERSTLITLARAAVDASVRGSTLPVPRCEGILSRRLGCFVTLTNSGMLRGCIETFQPEESLGRTLVQMATAAATQDPRFTTRPITPTELEQLQVEVSVLSELVETDKPERLEVGKHGIYIVNGPRAGCFLPEVATDMGWSAQEFLDQCCCSKAGLPAGAWMSSQTKVYLFTSEKFSD